MTIEQWAVIRDCLEGIPYEINPTHEDTMGIGEFENANLRFIIWHLFLVSVAMFHCFYYVSNS